MKPSRAIGTTAIQIICLLPALMSGPFLIDAIAAAVLDYRISGLPTTIFEVLLGAGILSGIAASLVLISSGAHVRKDHQLARLVRAGLAVGIVGGCAVLIWIARFIEHDPAASAKGIAILSWAVFCGPPIALLAFQFLGLTRTIHRDLSREELPPQGMD
jgi:hypothetical protein